MIADLNDDGLIDSILIQGRSDKKYNLLRIYPGMFKSVVNYVMKPKSIWSLERSSTYEDDYRYGDCGLSIRYEYSYTNNTYIVKSVAIIKAQ